MTKAARLKMARQFREAAQLMCDDHEQHGACDAIDEISGMTDIYRRSDATCVFRDIFEMDARRMKGQASGYFFETNLEDGYGDDVRELRILGLLFAAELAEDGTAFELDDL